MTRFKIFECSEEVTKNGKPLKKMVLQGEGQQNTEPRVTLWPTHSQYEEAKVGFTITGTLEKKDSGVPIPAHPENNYVNRTLLDETNPNGTIALNVEERIAKLEKEVFGSKVEVEDTQIDYPEDEYPKEASPF